jgi:phosphoribosyl 1,2-cyclic phosphodiesterase
MFSLTVLGSGSAGNCAVVETDACRLLVDGGLSAKQIGLRLAAAGIQPIELDGILLTHEHCDHIGGLDVFCKKFATPIYCNPRTAEALRHSRDVREKCEKNFRFFETGNEFSIKDITVQTFPVPHDAVDPVGFVLHHGCASLGFCTDLGFATKLVFERLRAVHTLVIETNHDEKMLQEDTHRPWPVKQRIMSRHGHLSNGSAAEALVQLLDGGAGGLRRAVLGHLSRDCNRPELALETVNTRLASAGAQLEVFCAAQKDISPRFVI